MKSIFNRKNFNRVKYGVLTPVLLGTQAIHAGLPTVSGPSGVTDTSDGNYLAVIQGYAFDIGIIIGLMLATVAFLAVARNMIAVYNEIGDGKKTWGDMGMHGAMGVLLLVFIVFLTTQAAGVLNADGSITGAAAAAAGP